MRLKRYLLLEAPMSLDTALRIMGLTQDDLADKEKVKSTYRRLSQTAHPDKGGSTKMMQDLNLAYEVVSKTSSTTTGKTDWEKIYKDYRTLAIHVKNVLSNSFQTSEFTKYFGDMFGEVFTHTITLTPDEKTRNPNYAGMTVEIYNKDKSTVFEFDVHVNLNNLRGAASLGSSDVDFTLMVTAYGFHNNKKQKLSKTDYKWTNSHNVLKDPTVAFPKTKIQKIAKGSTSDRAFKRRDMRTYIEKKLDGSFDREFIRIPLVGEYRLTIYRATFMRTPFYMVNGIYSRYSRVNYGVTISMPEDEVTAKVLEDIQNTVRKLKTPSEEQIISTVNKMLEKYKGDLARKYGG